MPASGRGPARKEGNMKILAAIKRVSDPDNANKVKISSDGKSVTTEGLAWDVNPFCLYGVEAAIRLTEDGSKKQRQGEGIESRERSEHSDPRSRQGNRFAGRNHTTSRRPAILPQAPLNGFAEQRCHASWGVSC